MLLRDMQDGEWILSEELGLGRVQRTPDNAIFRPVGIDELVDLFDTNGGAVQIVDEENGVPRILKEENGPFFRWTQTRGRITQITEAAYRTAGQRAQRQYRADWVGLALAFEVFKQRVYMEGELGDLYRNILAAQYPGGAGLDETVDAIEQTLKKGQYSAAPKDILQPVVNLIWAVSKATQDDLVKAGVLHMLGTLSAGRVDGEAAGYIAGTWTADTWFFWTTELLEQGISILSDAEGQPHHFKDEKAGVAAMRLYPRSHPQYPVDAVSQRYFAAKTDDREMARLGQEYADQWIGLMAQHGFTLEQFDYIVPVPKQRGQHNQLLALTEALARKTGLPVRDDVAVKTIEAQKQKEVKSLPGKALNVVHSYTVDRPEEVKDKSIIVIDDHAGTRLTLLEMQYILLNAGARQVFILALSDSPAKDGVNREIQVVGVHSNLAQQITLTQKALAPAKIQEWLNEIIKALPAEKQIQARAAAEAIGRRVSDILFRYNLVDEWAADLSARLINEDALSERAEHVVKRLLEQILETVLADSVPGEGAAAAPYVMRTNPARVADVLSGQYFAKHGKARPSFRLILSDYDGTLADTLTELKPAVIHEIVRQLKAGVIFGLVTQQNLAEIEYFFLNPIRRFLTAEGLDASLLNNLVFFAASGNTAYRVVSGEADIRVERLADMEALLTPAQAQRVEEILWEFESIRPNHVSNRENGIWTLYFNSAVDKDIAREVLSNAFTEAGLPVQVVDNGTYRLRVVAEGLSKARIWDYISSRFSDIAPQEILVLGDNYDPENALSDIGLKNGAAIDSREYESGVIHKELLGQLKKGTSLQEILWTRGIQPEEGLHSYESRVILPGLKGNVYRFKDAAVLTKQQALRQMGAQSIVYLLPGDGALLVEDVTDVVGLTGLHVIRSRKDARRLTAAERRVQDWVEKETHGERGVVIRISSRTVEALGLNTVSQLDQILRKALKLSNVDGVPGAYIGYRREEVPSSPIRGKAQEALQGIRSLKGEGIQESVSSPVPESAKGPREWESE
ncbi:MAG TPA: hypothetical protein PK470_00590, partial [Candidatus Omnitrophota bacterium]|nr:hypothetical protein [Candidatus Omnitrophota bacterium]